MEPEISRNENLMKVSKTDSRMYEICSKLLMKIPGFSFTWFMVQCREGFTTLVSFVYFYMS